MTPIDRNHYQDWELFALGVLDDEEQRDMSAHVASGCEDCAKLLLSAEALVAGLATLSPDVPLPPGAEMRFKNKLESEGAKITFLPESISQSSRWSITTVAAWVLAAACLVAAIGLEMSRRNISRQLQEEERQNAAYRLRLQQKAQYASIFSDKTSAEIAGLQSTIKGLKLDLRTAESAKLADEKLIRSAQQQVAEESAGMRKLGARLKDAETHRAQAVQALSVARLQLVKAEEDAGKQVQVSAESERILTLLESPSLSHLDLQPVGGMQASARVFWQNDHGLLLVARNLPQLPEHESFQLWFYRKGTPDVVHVGALKTAESGNGLLFVPPGPDLLAMTGALITEQSGSNSFIPGKEILKVKP